MMEVSSSLKQQKIKIETRDKRYH